jgi:two-component system phosphate regulon response regulator PhoB
VGAGPERSLILLVEDDRGNLVLTRAVLEEAGYRVLGAGSADEARELLAVERPDLVLTDIELPGDSGLDLVREIAQDPRTASIPVIVLTAHVTAETRVAAFEAGSTDFLTKPVDIRELVLRVGAILAR